MINAVIGSSVFGLPSVIGGKLGGRSPLAWLIAAVVMGIILGCFAEVASRFREAGGPYLYARAAYGPFAGIQMGWLAYLTRLTATATNANLFVIYLAQFWAPATAPLASRLILAVLIGGLALVNLHGVRGGGRVSSLLAAAKLVPLGGFILLGSLFAFGPRAVHPAELAGGGGVWLDALLPLMFAYGGFEAALLPLAEAKDPRRDAPFALFVTLGTCALVYTLAQLTVITTLPDPAAEPRPLAAAAAVLAGSPGATVLALAALISVWGYLAGATLNAPRLTFAMAERGDLPAVFAAVHPRYRTPQVSLGLFAILVWLLASSGSFLQNLTLSAVSRLFTYGMVCGALVVFRRREGQADLPAALFRLPAGEVLAVVGIVCSLLLATRMTGREGMIVGVTMLLGSGNWWWRSSRSQGPTRR